GGDGGGVGGGGEGGERGGGDLAERRGVDVAPAGQEQAVETLRQPLQGGGAELGRQGHRHPSGLLDRVQVGGVDVGPLGLSADGDGRAHADQGSAIHGAML